MRKAIAILSGVAAVAVAFTTSIPQAHAQRGGAVAAGVIGGIAAGALIAGAAQQNRTYYSGPGYYEPSPAYAPVYGRCYTTREYDGYRYRRVRVCD